MLLVSVVALTTKSHQNLVFKNKFVYMPKNFHVHCVTEAAKNISFKVYLLKYISGKAIFKSRQRNEVPIASIVLHITNSLTPISQIPGYSFTALRNICQNSKPIVQLSFYSM